MVLAIPVWMKTKGGSKLRLGTGRRHETSGAFSKPSDDSGNGPPDTGSQDRNLGRQLRDPRTSFSGRACAFRTGYLPGSCSTAGRSYDPVRGNPTGSPPDPEEVVSAGRPHGPPLPGGNRVHASADYTLRVSGMIASRWARICF